MNPTWYKFGSDKLTAWLAAIDDNELTVLLCFDLPKRLCGDVIRVLEDQARLKSLTNSRISVLPPILFSVVITEFERGLWSFQGPVRTIEKVSRGTHGGKGHVCQKQLIYCNIRDGKACSTHQKARAVTI